MRRMPVGLGRPCGYIYIYIYYILIATNVDGGLAVTVISGHPSLQTCSRVLAATMELGRGEGKGTSCLGLARASWMIDCLLLLKPLEGGRG